jgi:hypothetical protein
MFFVDFFMIKRSRIPDYQLLLFLCNSSGAKALKMEKSAKNNGKSSRILLSFFVLSGMLSRLQVVQDFAKNAGLGAGENHA